MYFICTHFNIFALYLFLLHELIYSTNSVHILTILTILAIYPLSPSYLPL